MVGTGKDHENLYELVKATEIDDFVIFAGEQHNPFPYYRAASVFVLPSRKEGFPNALLEAMAVGLPVIAANCDTGPSEILNNGVNGLLIPVENVKALSEAIEKLYHDKALCEKLGKNAKKTIESDYQFKDKMNQFEKILLDLLERSKKNGAER